MIRSSPIGLAILEPWIREPGSRDTLSTGTNASEGRKESELSGITYQLAPDFKSDEDDGSTDDVNQGVAGLKDNHRCGFISDEDDEMISGLDVYFDKRDSALLSLISVASATTSRLISDGEEIENPLVVRREGNEV
jgi:hypothetical protein